LRAGDGPAGRAFRAARALGVSPRGARRLSAREFADRDHVPDHLGRHLGLSLSGSAGADPSHARAVRRRQARVGIGHAQRRALLHLSPISRLCAALLYVLLRERNGCGARRHHGGNVCIERKVPRVSDDFDPIAFELFKNAIFSIADEMALTIFRTTYSGVLKDNMDYSTALADADGKLVAQGLTLPGHLGSVPTAMASIMRHFGNDIAPGDVFIMNDP